MHFFLHKIKFRLSFLKELLKERLTFTPKFGPQFPKNIGEREHIPVFLKSIWGTGTVPQVPQKYLGDILGNIWGTFGE